MMALYSAEVPEKCDLPRQRLVDGRTAETFESNPEARGWVTGDWQGSLAPMAFIEDVAGRGDLQALAVYHCHAGGIGWPPSLILTDADGTLLAHVDLATYLRETDSQMYGVTLTGSDTESAVVTWTSEGSGPAPETSMGRVAFQGDALTVEDIVVEDR